MQLHLARLRRANEELKRAEGRLTAAAASVPTATSHPPLSAMQTRTILSITGATALAALVGYAV